MCKGKNTTTIRREERVRTKGLLGAFSLKWDTMREGKITRPSRPIRCDGVDRRTNALPDRQTDRPTDQPTDKASYRGA